MFGCCRGTSRFITPRVYVALGHDVKRTEGFSPWELDATVGGSLTEIERERVRERERGGNSNARRAIEEERRKTRRRSQGGGGRWALWGIADSVGETPGSSMLSTSTTNTDSRPLWGFPGVSQPRRHLSRFSWTTPRRPTFSNRPPPNTTDGFHGVTRT